MDPAKLPRKPEAWREARRLRGEEGRSVRSIAEQLGVARSSVSRWVRDVELTGGQLAALRAANPALNGRGLGTAVSSARARAARVAAQAQGRLLALSGTSLHRTGCMLYWAEGSKGCNHVSFTNADADMVDVFLQFLRECYGVADDRVALTVNCHLGNGLSLGEIERWWLDRLALPASALRPSVVNRPSRASKGRHRVLLRGTARVDVNSTFIVQSIYGGIQEYAGIERPEWLETTPRRHTPRVSPPSTSRVVPVT